MLCIYSCILLTHRVPGLFIDGVPSDSLQWAYPKFDETSPATFMVGDDVTAVESSWCVASAYLLSVALGKHFLLANGSNHFNICR